MLLTLWIVNVSLFSLLQELMLLQASKRRAFSSWAIWHKLLCKLSACVYARSVCMCLVQAALSEYMRSAVAAGVALPAYLQQLAVEVLLQQAQEHQARGSKHHHHAAVCVVRPS